MDLETGLFHAFPMGKQRKRAKKPVARTWPRLRITEALAAKDKTQAWLAEKSGYSEGYISLLNKGKRRYNQDVIDTLETALGVPQGTIAPEPAEGDLLAIWNTLSPSEQARLVRAIKDPEA